MRCLTPQASGDTGVELPPRGYRVIELWDSREAFPEWFDGHIAPNLPPNAEVTEPEFFDLTLELTPKA